MKHASHYSFLFFSILFVLACSKSSSPASAPTPPVATVSTLAGNGTSGNTDGTGTAAQFSHPYGIAVDASGNLYVSDQNNSLVRKITSPAVVTTLAGSSNGYADGTGAAAKFFGPAGVAVDASGNIYVADGVNNRIRKITSGGVVTTLAGGTQGYLDGTGTAAQFFSPTGIAVDASGNVYVADTYNQRIRKISTAGVATTLAGSGPTGPGNGGYTDGAGTVAQFNAPAGLAVDASGNIYVADYNNFLIRKITAAGLVTTLAGSVAGELDGAGISAEFGGPTGIAVDASGNIYVADNLSTIRKITPGGLVTTIAGSLTAGHADGVGAAAQFSGPTGIAVDAAGNVYVADYGNNLIREITFK